MVQKIHINNLKKKTLKVVSEYLILIFILYPVCYLYLIVIIQWFNSFKIQIIT